MCPFQPCWAQSQENRFWPIYCIRMFQITAWLAGEKRPPCKHAKRWNAKEISKKRIWSKKENCRQRHQKMVYDSFLNAGRDRNSMFWQNRPMLQEVRTEICSETVQQYCRVQQTSGLVRRSHVIVKEISNQQGKHPKTAVRCVSNYRSHTNDATRRNNHRKIRRSV